MDPFRFGSGLVRGESIFAKRRFSHGTVESGPRAKEVMEGIMAGGVCARPSRTWNSRAAGRTESRREQQFYRCVNSSCCLFTDLSVACCTDDFTDTMAHFDR
jgi:hypothetical protein